MEVSPLPGKVTWGWSGVAPHEEGYRFATDSRLGASTMSNKVQSWRAWLTRMRPSPEADPFAGVCGGGPRLAQGAINISRRRL